MYNTYIYMRNKKFKTFELATTYALYKDLLLLVKQLRSLDEQGGTR